MPHRTRERLRAWLLVAGAAMALPLITLLSHVYRQLQQEAFYRHQAAAMQVVNRINQRFYDLLKIESERPFDHYSFWSIAQSQLVPKGTLSISPLAQLPPPSSIPGTIGYYQIDPNGSFHSPSVPESSLDHLQRQESMAVDAAERTQRLALRDRLRTLLQWQQDAHRQESVPPTPAASLQNKFAGSVQRTPIPAEKDSASEVRAKAEKSPVLDERLYEESKKLPERLATPNENDSLASGKVLSQQPRKEVLNYVEREDMASAQPAPSRANSSAPADIGAQAPASTASAAKEQDADVADTAKVPVFPALVKSMAGEIYPIEFERLSGGDFAFFRKVWRDSHMYVQGFVVDAKTCLREILSAALGSDPATATIAIEALYQGQALPYKTQPQPPSAILLHRANLATPLSKLELVLTTPSLALGPGLALVIGAAGFLAVLIPAILYGVYRLGCAQIDLAQQRSNFVAAVSHELRTPLTSIRMYSEILRAGWTDSEAKQQSYYDFIFFESERLSRLISNVLLLAKLGNNDLALQLKPWPADVLLEQLRGKIVSMAEAAGFELTTENATASVAVLVEEDTFQQIMINLVDNALKFSRNSTRKQVCLGIRLDKQDPSALPLQLAFYVRDFGPGIDPARAESIFDLFTRGEDELTRSTPGTGIGLALVQELAHKLNARVCFVQHELGVEFQVWLPGTTSLT